MQDSSTTRLDGGATAEIRFRWAQSLSWLEGCHLRRSFGSPLARRLAMLADIPILGENPDVDRVADELIARSLIPAAARVDALHLAIAALRV